MNGGPEARPVPGTGGSFARGGSLVNAIYRVVGRIPGPVRGLAAASLAVLLLAACGRKHPPSAEAPPGDLAVAAALPRGEVESRASVDVVFDRPVVALGKKDPSLHDGAGILELDPRPEGYYHWVGTRTLSYVVTGGLPPATAFRARVKAGVKAVDGTRLAEAVTWEFSTPRPALVASIPAPGDSLMRPGDPLVLAFNQPMDPREVADAAEVGKAGPFEAVHPDSAFRAGLSWDIRRLEPERVVVLTPKHPLEPDHAYTLALKADLRGRSGPLPLGDEIRIPFRTYGPPGLASAAGHGGTVLDFRTPMDPDTVRAYLALEPVPSKLEVWGNGTRVGLGGLRPGTVYHGTLAAGLPDLFGQRMGDPASFTLTTDDRPLTLEISPETSVMALTVPREVAVGYGGAEEVTVRAARLTPALEAQQANRADRPVPHWDLERTLYRGPADNGMTRARVDLVPLVGDGPGAVLVEVSGTGAPARPGGGPVHRSRRVILRWSGLGLTVKTAAGPGLAWVTRLETGEPVPGARVSILDGDAKAFWSGTTGAGGRVSLPGLAGRADRLWELNVTAEAPQGAAVIPAAGDWRLSPWRFGVPGDYGMGGSDHEAFLYGDRDLYRPGETIHLAGLVRRRTAGGLAPAALDRVGLQVRGPQGESPVDTVLAVGALGGFALDVPTTAADRVGSWSVSALDLRSDPPRTLGTTTVRLAAYRAPTFRTRVEAADPEVFPGGTVAARVAGSYYFGAPLAGAAFTWTLTRTAERPAPEGFEDYVFGNLDEEGARSGRVASGSGALGDSGTAGVRVPLEENAFSGSQVLTLEAVVRDPTGDTVSGRAAFRYHPASVIPGVGLSRDFESAGTPVTLRLVAVRADSAEAVSGVPLRVEFARREWRTVRKLLVGGRVGYETSRTDTLLATESAVSGNGPVELSWSPPTGGAYRVTVTATDERGRTSASAADFYVSGGEDLGPRRDDPFLQLTLDRDRYRPGETARLLLTTPVRARHGVLTVERGSVISSRVVDLAGPAPSFEIPVEPGFLPDVFVGLSVVEPAIPESAAPGLPPPARLPAFRAGYAQLRVDTSSRRLTVEAAPDREAYAPGDTARVAIRVRTAAGAGTRARVSVAVVDEAVLALLGTPVPDPFTAFYAPQGLGVRNDDTRLRLSTGVTEESAEAKGNAGGGGAEAASFRSVFATTAYWNPAVMTDASGRATVAVPLTDNLTRYRIVAVAAADADRFGSGSAGFRITRPLTVEPALPRFARTGDFLELAALVTNRTASALAGTVRVATGLELTVPAEQAVTVGAGRSVRVAFGARVTGDAGAPVRFTGSFGGVSDRVEVTLPVERPEATRTAAGAGATTGSRNEIIELPPESLPGTATLDLSLSPSAVAGAERAFRYVVQYPYGCLEQLSSRVLVLALYRELSVNTASSWGDSLRLDEKLRDGVAALQELVLPWGGFSFWPGGAEASPAMEAYAAYALARADRAGASVSPELLQRAAEVVRRNWDRILHQEDVARNRGRAGPEAPTGPFLFAATELAAAGIMDPLPPADLDVLANRTAQLGLEDRILVALALHHAGLRPEAVSQVMEEARNRLDLTAAGATAPSFDSPFLPVPFRTATRATALTLLLQERVRPEDALTPKLAHGLLGLREHGHWGSTQDDALALLALTGYRDRVEHGEEAFTAEVTLQGRREPILTGRFAARSLAEAETTLALPEAGRKGTPLKLRFERLGRGNLYYEAILRWKENPLEREPRDAGYTLARDVAPLGRGEGAPRLGDLVVVTLTVVAPRESYYLALRDPLPAGLEPVETGFLTESRAAAAELGERRPLYPDLPIGHVERRDREVRVFADFVPAGIYQVRYLARVRAAGTFGHPPAEIEAMYAPELNGSSGSPPFTAEGSGR